MAGSVKHTRTPHWAKEQIARRDQQIVELKEELDTHTLRNQLLPYMSSYVGALIMMAAFKPELRSFLRKAMEVLPVTLSQNWQQQLDATLWSTVHDKKEITK